MKKNSVHFIGIGGIGVSSLAYWFKAQSLDKLGTAKGRKWAVFGSDSVEGKITLDLKKDGFKVKIGHKRGLLGPKTDLVIYSNAIGPDNPELREARRRGIPMMSYPEAVGTLTRRYRTFGVAGAHGKSTTTALLSLVLIKAGWDPTVIVGTKLKEFGGRNFRLGKSNYLVLEADEWKGAFWNYSPFGAIITNIDREHLDFYKNFGNVKKSFLKYIGNIQTGGILVANRDSEKLFSLKKEIEKITKRNGVELVWYSIAVASPPLVSRLKRNLSVPGKHNLQNAMAVYVLARNLGIPENKILRALKGYHGAWRRMEFRGELRIRNKELGIRDKKVKAKRGDSIIHNSKFIIPIYDDYAHHPTEIKATLQAFREKYPDSKIICVFQPHQAHRLKMLFNDFAHAFNDADSLILLPSYKVAGRDVSSKKYTSENLAKKIKGAIYLKNPRNLKKAVEKAVIHNSKFIIHNSVLIMMGAGTIVNSTDELLRKMK
ncbi:MAG: UDP-N-acetylmuramate--L-alanine ligase [Patescibacteria group bacterium]